MPFDSHKRLAGVAISLAACLAAVHPGIANPIDAQNSEVGPVGQVNRPPEEGTPRILTRGVRGIVKSVGGNRVTLELEDGDTETYYIPAEFENREGLEVGNEVILTIERGFVVAINTPEEIREESSTTVIRRETRVQPAPTPTPTPAPAARPAPPPAPTPAPVVQPSPQPVRGMW